MGNQGKGQDQEDYIGFAQERLHYRLGLHEAKGPEADDKAGGYDGLPGGEGVRYAEPPCGSQRCGSANASVLQIFTEDDEDYRRYRERRDGDQGGGASQI